MLEVGNGGMTDDEYKTHFSMWSMLAAPLMAGNDLRNMNKSTKDILTNADVIAINQDKLGLQATRFMDMGETEIWAKPLFNGEIAVCFMNRTNLVWKLDYNWQKQIMYFASEVDLKKKVYNIYDVWEHKTIGKTNEKLIKDVPAHGIVMVRLSETK
jgi:alpha-galactosidase